MTLCPLCNLNPTSEVFFLRDPHISVVRTKKMKGHRERVMVLTNDHVEAVPNWLFDHAVEKAIEVGKRVFNYTPKFVVMESTYASIRDHWHLVLSDLDPKSEDFELILKTKWLKVVDTTEVKTT